MKNPSISKKTANKQSTPESVLLHHHHENENARFPEICDMLASQENFQKVADIFKQLGDNTRLRIFWLLCHQEECVINIAALMNMSSPAVAHHLRELKNSGLLTNRREGKETYYKASGNAESILLHQMIEQVMEITCPK